MYNLYVLMYMNLRGECLLACLNVCLLAFFSVVFIHRETPSGVFVFILLLEKMQSLFLISNDKPIVYHLHCNVLSTCRLSIKFELKMANRA